MTKPSLPPIKEIIPYLEKIWKTRIVTNYGEFHFEFEKKLTRYFGVKYVSLFNTGMSALQAALKALEIEGEIITTPYTFIATSNAIILNNCTPVFCDIENDSLNLDPKKIETLITKKSKAILPVHVYGLPCKVNKIQDIANYYGLRCVYDAAHAFGVKLNGKSLLSYGDLSVVSFHGTKVFNTFEGGAVVTMNLELKKKIDLIKNFGIADEENVIEIGSNGKMDEFHSALGILQLKYIKKNILKRKKLTQEYRRLLKDVKGISYLKYNNNVEYNYEYFPLFINCEKYGMCRDDLFNILKKNNVICRKYFYPIVNEFDLYKNNIKIKKYRCENAKKASERVICLPLYPELKYDEQKQIIRIIIEKQ